jgi:UDP-N-acetylmuramyl pentapeptide phosphotransferase/UDP-N-acetylglucosamine-1-phosphate transferase
MSFSLMAVFFAIIILFACEYFYIRIAAHCGLFAHARDCKGQQTKIVNGGGIIFFISMLLYEFLPVTSEMLKPADDGYVFVLAGLTIVSIVSFIDDIRDIKPSIRLIVQLISVGLIYYQLSLMGYSMPWYFVVLFLILGTGFINGYNFMDGIAGITGCYSIVTLLTLTLLDIQFNYVGGTYFIFPMIAAFVFLIFNFRRKELCFAGDVGSISMAFIILFPLSTLILCTGDFAMLTIVAVYGVDIIFTIVRRLILHENITTPHHHHLYQTLTRLWHWPHRVVASIYSILQLAISIGFLCTPMPWHCLYFIITCVALSAVYLLVAFSPRSKEPLPKQS